jgi:hypothetical protein
MSSGALASSTSHLSRTTLPECPPEAVRATRILDGCAAYGLGTAVDKLYVGVESPAGRTRSRPSRDGRRVGDQPTEELTMLLPDALLQDLKHGVRQLVKERGLTTAAVVALALGLGVSTTIMTVLYGMNVRALPFERPATIMGVGVEGGDTTYGLFELWRPTRSVAGIAAHADAAVNLRDDEPATDQVLGTFLSHNTFKLLGVQPVLGRDFDDADDRVGAPAVAILGDAV